MLRWGWRSSTPENSQSVRPMADVMNTSVPMTAGGASADVVTKYEPEPMCIQITVAVSSHAAKYGSQNLPGSWIDGSPSFVGSSVNATALTPREALRLTSSAASVASHMGMMQSGARRPPESPAHS